MTFDVLPVSFKATHPFSAANRRRRIFFVCASLASIVAFAPKAQAQGVTFSGTTQSINFGSVNVCPAGHASPAPCNSTLSLSYHVAANTTIGSISILTSGAANLDFRAKANDHSGTLCSTRTFTTALTCTVDVTFAPLAPGQRQGAVQILDGSGNILVNTYIYGTGGAPAITFQPGTQTNLSGFSGPAGLAVDGNGNLFLADITAVKEVVAVNGVIPTNPQIKVLLTGDAEGLALDGSGDVFVAVPNSSEIQEIVAVGGSIPANPTVRTLGSGFNTPHGVAVDGSGNVFVADTFNSAIKEILAVNGSIPDSPTINTLGTLGFPFGVAVDGSGDVFVASFSGTVSEILAVNGSIPANPTINSLGSGFTNPVGVAVDAAGDVFVADFGNGIAPDVYEILAVNGSVPASNPTIHVLGSGFTQPRSVAIDGRGNVYAGDASGIVATLDFADPPSLSFASTAVGSTSTQSVTIQNVGNQSLHAVAPGLHVSGSIFVQTPGSGTPEDCSASFALTSGATCNLSLSFEPQTLGPASSTAVFTDNALNANSATQSIALNGTGAQGQTITFTTNAPASAAFGSQFSVAATATSGLAVTFTSSGSCVNSGNTYQMTSGFGSCTVIANQSGSGSNFLPAPQVTESVAASQASTTTVVTSTPNPSVVGQSVTFVATVTQSSGDSPPSGTVSFEHLGAVIGTGSLSNGVASFATSTLPLNTANHIIAVYSGNATYTGSTSAALAQTVNKAPTTTTLTSNANPAVLGQPITFTATVTPASGPAPPGTVSFEHLGAVIGTGKLANDVASFTTSTLPLNAATHITAVYPGGAMNTGSTSAAVTQVINKTPTTTVLTSTPNPSVLGQAVTFTATVTAPFGTVLSGTVSFEHLGAVIGTGNVTNGVASFTTSALPLNAAGNHIIAAYSGSAANIGSTSAPVAQVVH